MTKYNEKIILYPRFFNKGLSWKYCKECMVYYCNIYSKPPHKDTLRHKVRVSNRNCMNYTNELIHELKQPVRNEKRIQEIYQLLKVNKKEQLVGN